MLLQMGACLPARHIPPSHHIMGKCFLVPPIHPIVHPVGGSQFFACPSSKQMSNPPLNTTPGVGGDSHEPKSA